MSRKNNAQLVVELPVENEATRVVQPFDEGNEACLAQPGFRSFWQVPDSLFDLLLVLPHPCLVIVRKPPLVHQSHPRTPPPRNHRKQEWLCE